MKYLGAVSVMIVMAIMLSSCSATEQALRTESQQQGRGVLTIVNNQPVPDLNGYSWEREILRQTYVARNSKVATYTYITNLNGDLIEICPSLGYPIPYSTQMTNPQVYVANGGTLPQPEPNSLYPPSDAAATLVACVNAEGQISPAYVEQDVMAFPFRVESARQIKPIGNSSFTIKGQ